MCRIEKVLFAAFIIVFYSAHIARLKRKNRRTFFFCWQEILAHNSGHGWDRKVLFSVIIIVFYSPHDKTKTKTIADKQFSCSKFSANLAVFRCNKFAADFLLTL